MMTSSSKRCHGAQCYGLAVYLIFALLCAVVCVCLLSPDRLAWAQTNAVEPDTANVLSKARKQINEIRHILVGQIEGVDLPTQHATILEVQSKVKCVLDTLQPHLDRVTARLQALGPIGAHETRDIAAQRAQLEAQRGLSDTQIKLARLLILETSQMSEQISTLQRAQFQAKLGERHDAFISSVSWSELRAELPGDLQHLKSLGQELCQAALSTPLWIWATLGSLAVLAIAMYIGIERWLLRLTATRVPPGRLRCSFLVVAKMLLAITVPGLVAELIRMGIIQNTTLAEDTDAMLCSLITTIYFGAYVWGFMLSYRPSTRLGVCLG
jgi:potassium-dependent mechanosensitive channel